MSFCVFCTACADNCRYCTVNGAGKCDSCNNGFRLTSANLCEGWTFLHLYTAFYYHARHMHTFIWTLNAIAIVVSVFFCQCWLSGYVFSSTNVSFR